ncbi:hypothetical protein CPLU01_11443 [Colletotrichum plurivorum]|uniref:Uncharacterized protein n=1 Tax=Colletotrichum plurivorum TaxID=2175906 RepID=A0A8H6K1K1_9PEZI|nr:hypothetical protein CPLU01_11443 [Colletotrichum plurivorum]
MEKAKRRRRKRNNLEEAVEEILRKVPQPSLGFPLPPSFQIEFQLLVLPDTQGFSAGRSLAGLAVTTARSDRPLLPSESVMLPALGNGNFWWMTWCCPSWACRSLKLVLQRAAQWPDPRATPPSSPSTVLHHQSS